MSNITDRDKAVFEAGIKLGAMYHQFVGTPISRKTADKVEDAIKSAISLQPYITNVEVHLDRTLMNPNEYGYTELTGSMFNVTVETQVGNEKCKAKIEMDNGYPLMKLIE